MNTTAISSAHASRSLWADERVFRDTFDQEPFTLAHKLSDHPLFELKRLVRLAGLVKSDSNNVVYDAGAVHVEDRWNRRPPKQYTLDEAMERIACAGAWVILKHAERDREYRALMETIMSDIQLMSERDLRKVTKNLEAQIMLTSPNRITPYHLDNECNILLQIKGEKDIYIFDQRDREVLTEAELERFWVGDWNAGEYKMRCQDRARVFHLIPGMAVHIPVNAPHWVKNSDNVSISLSINFEWKNELVPNVYRANCFLRKLGIEPKPPGQSRVMDNLKGITIATAFVPARGVARGSVRFIRRLRRTGLKKSTNESAVA
jgi:hypothetical protein